MDEDDAQTSNTRIPQRKRAIPHSTMKNNRGIIECCNNIHQGCHVPTNKRALALRTSVTLVTLPVHCAHFSLVLLLQEVTVLLNVKLTARMILIMHFESSTLGVIVSWSGRLL